MATKSNEVWITLRRSVGIRTPGSGAGATLIGPGRVKVSRDVARSLGQRGEPVTEANAEVGNESATVDPYKGWKREDYEAEVERRQLKGIKRTDGKDDELRIQDFRAALVADDANAPKE